MKFMMLFESLNNSHCELFLLFFRAHFDSVWNSCQNNNALTPSTPIHSFSLFDFLPRKQLIALWSFPFAFYCHRFLTIYLLIVWNLKWRGKISQRSSWRIARSIANWRNLDWIFITRCISIANMCIYDIFNI